MLTQLLLTSRISERATKMIAQVDELQHDSLFEAGVAVNQLPNTTRTLPTTQSLIGNTANINMKRVWECLMDDKIRIIGIQGIGGVGKTTIMKHIHNRLKDTNLFGDIIWVTISKDLNLKRLQSDVAMAIQLGLPDDDDEIVRSELLHEALLRKKKYVLFLDDLWKAFSLEDIGIPEPNENNGCKIVLTTRSLKVCRGMETQRDISVRVLSEDEAWDLFSRKVGNEVLIPSDIQRIARLVVEECEGLPLALITVGLALRKENDIRVWSNALDELRGSTYNIGDMYEKVFVRLKFSYDRLKDENVKDCFLYCSLYPEDHEIRVDRLIECWIWEGLIDEVGNIQIERNRGYSILNELKCTGMLEGVSDDQSYVKMHDLIRGMAIGIITRGNIHFMVKAGVGLTKQPKDNEWVEDIKTISLAFNNLEVLQGQPNCPKLSTLFLQNNTWLREISSSFFHYMHNLRVVDLSYTSVVSLPESLSGLVNLRALYITECWLLESLPSLAKLKELRVLHLKSVRIEPPQGMESLVNLRCLDLMNTHFMLRAGILPNLSVLEELSVGRSMCRWDMRNANEIIGLTQLRKLSLYFRELPTFLSYVKSGHWRVLQSFNFTIGRSGFDICDDLSTVVIGCCEIDNSSLQLPYSTIRLYIIDCRGINVLAEILLEVRNLKHIQISHCEDVECIFTDEVNLLLSTVETMTLSGLPKLGAISMGVMPGGCLASLKVLRIEHCDELRNVFSRESVCLPQNLEEIYVEQCSLLEEIIVGKGEGRGAHKRLRILQIIDCPKLKTLFSSEFLQSLKCLEEIKVEHCTEMEQMVLEEDEICQVKNAITLQRLQHLSLNEMPNLKYISERVLICNSLHNIKLKSCPQLRNLPLSMENPTSTVSGYISGSREWLDGLEWDDNTKTIVLPLFREGLDNPDGAEEYDD